MVPRKSRPGTEEEKVVAKHIRICNNCEKPFNVTLLVHCRCNMWEAGKSKNES